MRTLYFDCFSGISGDMVLGAFLDLGIEEEYLKKELGKLHLEHYELFAEKTSKMGISGTHCHVRAEEEHVHRHFCHIRRMIEESELDEPVKNTAVAVFRRVAEAEAAVHGVDVEQVHFHEVGALDSIIDIVGAAICFHKLAPERVLISGINTGSGWVKCAHGRIPVPAPATVEILAKTDIPMYSKYIEEEAATPTGAAIAAELAEYVPEIPEMKVKKVAYGFGTKEFPVLNGLRFIYGETTEKKTGTAEVQNKCGICEKTDQGKNADQGINADQGKNTDQGENADQGKNTDQGISKAENRKTAELPDTNMAEPKAGIGDSTILILETNIDDMTGESAGYVMERLLEAGAKDVFYTPIYMKKNRPAIMLTVLASPLDESKMADILLGETTTIGIRKRMESRICMERYVRTVNTPYGDVRVKVCDYGNIHKESFEYEDVAQIAKAAKKSHLDMIRELTFFL